MSAAGKVAYYTYDAEGHRIGKHYEDILYFIPEGGISYTTVRFPVDTKYFYSGDTLTYVQIIDDSARDIENLKSLYFTYDAVGPLSVNYNGTEYFYLKNAQGDVTGIVDAAGTQVVAYTYDAWGKLLSTTGSMAGTLGEYNPLRYRGYVYDTETGLYYLNSRYYNPETGRFINADAESLITASPDSATWDKNLFAYCDNNPIVRVDNGGNWWHVIVGAAVGVVAQYISDITISLAQGEDFADALKPTSTWVDYGAAALSGAFAATSIGLGTSVVVNAAISSVTYITNSAISNEAVSVAGIVESAVVGAGAGVIGGKGANAKNLQGVVKTSKEVLKTAVSTKKIAMYEKKIISVKKETAASVARTFLATLASNIANAIKAIGKWR